MSQVVRIHEYGSADVLRIDDIDVPAPAADEVQIRVKAIGLNRAEVMFRNGAYLQEAQFPSRLGYEAAGMVEAVGSAVSGFTAGDAVSVVPPPSSDTFIGFWKKSAMPFLSPSLVEPSSHISRKNAISAVTKSA